MDYNSKTKSNEDKYSYHGVLSDRYYREEDEMKERSKMYESMDMAGVEPVDMNGACVKEKQGNGLSPFADKDSVQYNIRERFGMTAKSDYEDTDGDY